MKHLKTFNLFEAAIVPLNFDELIKEIKKKKFKDLKELNDISLKYDVEFVTFDEFYNSLGTEKEKEVAPKNLEMVGGMKFGVFNKYTKKMSICVIPDKFIKFINNLDPVYGKMFLNFLDLILQHESIHMQQVNKMKVDNYLLDSSPEINTKKYYSEKREIMAYAHSIVFELSKQIDKQELINYLRSGALKKHSQQYRGLILKLDEEDVKLLNKYIYQYIDIVYTK